MLAALFPAALKSLRGLSDLVDLGAAPGAGPHRCRLAVLHGDRLGILHLNLHLVFKAIPFHLGFLTLLHSKIREGPAQPGVL